MFYLNFAINSRAVGDASPYKTHGYTDLVGDDVLGVPFFIFGVLWLKFYVSVLDAEVGL